LLDFFDLSDLRLGESVAVEELDSVLVLLLSDFLVPVSELFFSLVLVLLVLGELAVFSADGLVFVADSAGLLAVEAGAAVALADGFVGEV
jgi:hypothetical protein